MHLTVNVDPVVAQAWAGMASDMGMEVDAFVRACVRTAGPRLLEAYGIVTEPKHCPLNEARRQATIASYRARMLEGEL